MSESQVAPRRPRLAALFFSSAEHRLRAGWRLLIQGLLQLALTLGGGCALLLVPGTLGAITGELDALPALAIAEVVEIAAVTLSVFVARRLLDHRSFASLGLALRPRALLDVIVGIVLAGMMMGLIFGAEFQLGWLRVDGFAWNALPPSTAIASAVGFLLVFTAVGWNEELMSRGYHLQTIASGLGLPWGWVLSSAIFGVLHLGNPNATWTGAAGIFFAGLFLGFAYIRTRQLWLPIGLHIGWNFFEGVVFGFPVSGLDVFRLVRTTVNGPVLWTGAGFGPEAGLIILPAIAVGGFLVHWYAARYKES